MEIEKTEMDMNKTQKIFKEDNNMYWQKELNNFQLGEFDSYLKFFENSNNTNNKSYLRKRITYTKVNLPDDFEMTKNKLEVPELFSTACLILLYKISNYNPTSVWFTYDGINQTSMEERLPLSNYLPLNTNLNPEMELLEAFNFIKKKLKFIKSKSSFFLETWLNNIKLLDKELSFYIGILTTFDISKFDKKFKLGFLISREEQALYICYNTKKLPVNKLPFVIHLNQIISLLINRNQIKIKDFSLLTEIECEKILKKCEGKTFDYPANTTVVSLFKKAATRFPNHTALKYVNKTLTYNQLDSLSDSFAIILSEKGFKANDLACIFMERNFELIIVIVAILKLNGSYVPIDIKYPIQRIDYILNNSNPKLLITQSKVKSKVLEQNTYTKHKIIYFEDYSPSQTKKASNLKTKMFNNSSLIYVIYTSGSTGAPKGVCVTHANVVNYAMWFIHTFKLNEKSCVDFSSSIGFDISISCTLVPLMCGASIAICPEENKLEPYDYLNHLKTNSVTHIECTPDYFNQMLSFPNEIAVLNKLKWILLGADALIKKDVERWLKLKPNSYVVNEYGPTECTVAVTAHIVTKNNINKYKDIIPIGKPAINTDIYILDEYLNLCSIGVIGELYISGRSVSLGYTDKNLSKASFITSSSGLIMYKTGDFVRLLPDGSIEYLGRRDDQIKIRGFRIELREIEDAMLKNSLIKQCKVLPKSNSKNGKFLIAYLVAYDKSKLISPLELRNYLRNLIPDYMFPSEYIWMDHFPTNSNGKVDLKQLVKTNNKLSVTCNEKKASLLKNVDNVTKKIFKVWCDVFNVSDIGFDADFFDLGGNSLLAIKLLTTLNKIFNLKLKTQTLFNHPTINKLSSAIKYIEQTIRIANAANHNSLDKEPEVICLQSTAKKNIPLFLIHPVGGTVYIFKKLSQLLGNDNRVYALQDPGIQNPLIRFKNIQEMAVYYLKSIKRFQSEGPYLLAGSSFGSTLAIEIANQIILSGEKVNFIGILDGWALHSKHLKDEVFFQKLMKDKVANFDKDYANALLRMQFSREKMLFKYKIPNILEKVTLFKAMDVWKVFAEINSPFNGWENYLEKDIETYNIPGDHESIFDEPNVRILAKYLKMCLDKISH